MAWVGQLCCVASLSRQVVGATRQSHFKPPPSFLPFAPLSGPAAVPRDCLSNRTRPLTNLQVACDLSAGITVALATTAPQLLKPLVPSAEGLAAILMQVKTSSSCLTWAQTCLTSCDEGICTCCKPALLWATAPPKAGLPWATAVPKAGLLWASAPPEASAQGGPGSLVKVQMPVSWHSYCLLHLLFLQQAFMYKRSHNSAYDISN